MAPTDEVAVSIDPMADPAPAEPAEEKPATTKAGKPKKVKEPKPRSTKPRSAPAHPPYVEVRESSDPSIFFLNGS